MNEWKALIGYEELYEINLIGQIKSINGRYKNRILSSKLDRAGYWRVKISKRGISSTAYVHRLLAINYIPNPNAKSCVNHINGIKSDNKLENLEWVTHSENLLHAYKHNLIKSKLKKVIDLSTSQIFLSCKEAATFFKINASTLKGYLNGTIKKNPTSLTYF